MPARPAIDFEGLLRRLENPGVDFIVVGGVCAVLHGAPVSTFDLDIVHSREPENLDRLAATLESLDAYYRGRADRSRRPTAKLLESPGHILLMTELGPLDVPGTIGEGLGYPELTPDSVELAVADLSVRALSLEALIRLKEESRYPKDRMIVPLLRELLEGDDGDKRGSHA